MEQLYGLGPVTVQPSLRKMGRKQTQHFVFDAQNSINA